MRRFPTVRILVLDSAEHILPPDDMAPGVSCSRRPLGSVLPAQGRESTVEHSAKSPNRLRRRLQTSAMVPDGGRCCRSPFIRGKERKDPYRSKGVEGA